MRFEGQALRDLFAAVDGLARKITGEWSGAEHGEPSPTRWRTVGQALRELVARRLDGYGLPPLGDPDRIARLVHTPGTSISTSHEPYAVRDADDVIEVERALALAYHVLPETGGVFDRGGCQRVLLARYVVGRTPLDIADRLRDDGIETTPKMVGRVTRYGHDIIARELAAAGLLPRLEQTMKPRDGVRVTDSDLFGWKEIASYMGVSVSTVQRWHRELGLPVRRFTVDIDARVEADSGELRAWRAQRVEGAQECTMTA